MVPILMSNKIEEYLNAGSDIAISILSLVNNTSGTFPPLQLAAVGALFIVTNIKVSSMDPSTTPLLTIHKGVLGQQESMGGVQPLCHRDGWGNSIAMGGG